MVDYIIIGAGSAGCVLANRLSADTQTTVLLLEAGGPDSRREIHIPAAFSKLFKTPLDWAYETEEQPALDNRKLFWPRGKMLGGSSSMNAMIYIRGNPRDYDRWAELGNEGWSFADVLPYFKRAENQQHGASSLHGAGGPLDVCDLRTVNPLSQAFVDACVESGIARNDDFNSVRQEGAGLYQVTQRQGQRHSAAAAYLRPALKRPNLGVHSNAQATRILFEGRRTVGVQYRQNGTNAEARARREVILCVGAVNSPQLLLLSGIGAAEQLKRFSLEVVMDLPGVGLNLQDHVATGVLYECRQPITLAGAQSPRHLLDYIVFKRGPLTSNVAEAGAFVRSQPSLAGPDLQFHFAPVYFANNGFDVPPGHGFTFGPSLLHPESRGQIALRSPDPLAPPSIQPNYFKCEGDLHVLLEGLKLSRRLAQAKAFEPYRGTEVRPGAAVQAEAALIAFVRQSAQTLYHPVGTCKMGSDPLAVVDAKLRVHGLEGLRVVDASIMPNVVSGNTNAPTIMLAEKASEMIRQ